MDKSGGYQDFPSIVFLSRSAEKVCRGNFCAVFQKISGSGILFGLEKGGGIKFSVEKFLSHNAESFQFSQRNHMC